MQQEAKNNRFEKGIPGQKSPQEEQSIWKRQKLWEEIGEYSPKTEQEHGDYRVITGLLKEYGERLLYRDLETFHFTSSGLIVNSQRNKVLFVHHKIYHTWCWTGGHADGDPDLLAVALREAEEETGVVCRLWGSGIASLDILPVAGHWRRGVYVPPHLHLNAAYLLEAREDAPVQVCPEENTGVQWFPLEEVETRSGEPQIIAVYRKMLDQLSRGKNNL